MHPPSLATLATFLCVGCPWCQPQSFQVILTRLTVRTAAEASSGVLSWAGARVPFIWFPSPTSFPGWRRWTGFTTQVGQLPSAPSWLIPGTWSRKSLRAPFHRDTQRALGALSLLWYSSDLSMGRRGRHLGKLVSFSYCFVTSTNPFLWILISSLVKHVILIIRPGDSFPRAWNGKLCVSMGCSSWSRWCQGGKNNISWWDGIAGDSFAHQPMSYSWDVSVTPFCMEINPVLRE